MVFKDAEYDAIKKYSIVRNKRQTYFFTNLKCSLLRCLYRHRPGTQMRKRLEVSEIKTSALFLFLFVPEVPAKPGCLEVEQPQIIDAFNGFFNSGHFNLTFP